MEQETQELLLSFFKTMSNETRLKIIGILATGEATVSELALMLRIKEPTISQHVTKLTEAGFVQIRVEETQTHCTFNVKALHQMNKTVFSRVAGESEEAAEGWQRQALKTYFDGERLLELPLKGRTLQFVLQRLAAPFEAGIRYSEHQVNEIMTRFHPDYATLRRELIDHGYLAREKGIYWKTTHELQPTEN
jgi:hypothetical protein